MAQYKGASRDAHRAKTLEKRRERQKEEMELMKNKLAKDLESKGGILTMGNKFKSHFDAVEQELKSSTIGLVTLNEMKAKQENIVQEHEKRIATESKEMERRIRKRKKEKEKAKAKQISALSFAVEDEDGEDEDEEIIITKKITKNPHVDTSFLPDRAREEEEKRERERLREEWVEKQKKLKDEDVDITYSYWDGSGHRKSCRMKKGDTIQKFLQKCLFDLRNQFTELRAAGVEHLMYVKEDLIIPHHYSFYDFILTKARGKSGPLFTFDAREDIRIKSDARIEKDESHAGKVVLRSWYERNKHIFPASRWEPYDPEKKWDTYTVSDKTKD